MEITEVKFWNMVAVAAIGLVWWGVKRYFNNIDKRFDAQDVKLDRIIATQEAQAKKILVHDIVIRKNFPEFIVNYPD